MTQTAQQGAEKKQGCTMSRHDARIQELLQTVPSLPWKQAETVLHSAWSDKLDPDSFVICDTHGWGGRIVAATHRQDVMELILLAVNSFAQKTEEQRSTGLHEEDAMKTEGEKWREATEQWRLEQDGRRFRWFFGAEKPKECVLEYITGMMNQWSLGDWRGWADRWREEEGRE